MSRVQVMPQRLAAVQCSAARQEQVSWHVKTPDIDLFKCADSQYS